MVENETKTEKECSRSTLVYEQYVASCNNKYLVKMYRIFDRPVQKSMYCMDQPSIGANPVRCQLNRTFFFLSPFAPENLVAQDGFGLSVPRQLPYSPQPRLSGLVWSGLVLTHGLLSFLPLPATAFINTLNSTAYRLRPQPRIRRYKSFMLLE